MARLRKRHPLKMGALAAIAKLHQPPAPKTVPLLVSLPMEPPEILAFNRQMLEVQAEQIMTEKQLRQERHLQVAKGHYPRGEILQHPLKSGR